MRRSSLIWGVALLLLGLLMFADAAGFRLGAIRPLSFFWPLALILLGGWLILGVTMRGRMGMSAEQASVDLQGATEADVKINHGAGELQIAGGAGPGLLASGTFNGGLDQSSRMTGNSLDVHLSPPGPPFMFLPHMERYDWDLRLNSEIPMTLTLQMGANKASVDLSNLHVTDLKVETGASQADITLPARGRMRAKFNLGAASLTIHVPQGVAARIHATHGVSDVKVDQSRFPRNGEYYQSPDYETAQDAAEIRIEAGAAEIKIQ